MGEVEFDFDVAILSGDGGDLVGLGVDVEGTDGFAGDADVVDGGVGVWFFRCVDGDVEEGGHEEELVAFELLEHVGDALDLRCDLADAGGEVSDEHAGGVGGFLCGRDEEDVLVDAVDVHALGGALDVDGGFVVFDFEAEGLAGGAGEEEPDRGLFFVGGDVAFEGEGVWVLCVSAEGFEEFCEAVGEGGEWVLLGVGGGCEQEEDCEEAGGEDGFAVDEVG